jgi:hypothetical protein
MGKMTLLLDTHIFLWWLFDNSRLPAGIRRAVENADNAVLISAASVWEITTKFRLGKQPWQRMFRFGLRKRAAVSQAHAQLAGAWELNTAWISSFFTAQKTTGTSGGGFSASFKTISPDCGLIP